MLSTWHGIFDVCPGSQISDTPLRYLSFNEWASKFALIKMDKGEVTCVSRRQIISSNKKEDEQKLLRSIKLGTLLKTQ